MVMKSTQTKRIVQEGSLSQRILEALIYAGGEGAYDVTVNTYGFSQAPIRKAIDDIAVFGIKKSASAYKAEREDSGIVNTVDCNLYDESIERVTETDRDGLTKTKEKTKAVPHKTGSIQTKASKMRIRISETSFANENLYQLITANLSERHQGIAYSDTMPKTLQTLNDGTQMYLLRPATKETVRAGRPKKEDTREKEGKKEQSIFAIDNQIINAIKRRMYEIILTAYTKCEREMDCCLQNFPSEEMYKLFPESPNIRGQLIPEHYIKSWFGLSAGQKASRLTFMYVTATGVYAVYNSHGRRLSRLTSMERDMAALTEKLREKMMPWSSKYLPSDYNANTFYRTTTTDRFYRMNERCMIALVDADEYYADSILGYIDPSHKTYLTKKLYCKGQEGEGLNGIIVKGTVGYNRLFAIPWSLEGMESLKIFNRPDWHEDIITSSIAYLNVAAERRGISEGEIRRVNDRERYQGVTYDATMETNGEVSLLLCATDFDMTKLKSMFLSSYSHAGQSVGKDQRVVIVCYDEQITLLASLFVSSDYESGERIGVCKGKIGNKIQFGRYELYPIRMSDMLNLLDHKYEAEVLNNPKVRTSEDDWVLAEAD